jgi:hypothetical protein
LLKPKTRVLDRVEIPIRPNIRSSPPIIEPSRKEYHTEFPITISSTPTPMAIPISSTPTPIATGATWAGRGFGLPLKVEARAPKHSWSYKG